MNYVGPLPPQREGQYQTMTICGTSDDPAERGHWSSPAHVQWRIDKAVAEERERWKLVRNLLARIHRDGGHYVEEHGLDKALEDADAKVVAWLALSDDSTPAVPAVSDQFRTRW